MAKRLEGKKIAVLVATGFEQVELTEPRQALLDAGATVELVSPDKEVIGFNHDKKGGSFPGSPRAISTPTRSAIDRTCSIRARSRSTTSGSADRSPGSPTSCATAPTSCS